MSEILNKHIPRMIGQTSSLPGYGRINVNDKAIVPGKLYEIDIIVREYDNNKAKKE